MPALRLTAYAEQEPGRRVLVSISPTASAEELRAAVGDRLGVRSLRLCLAESQSEVVATADLRDGDVLRVTPVPAVASTRSGVQFSAKAGESHRETWRDSPAWRELVRWTLTLLIFVLLFQCFQRWVFVPTFRPDLADENLLEIPLTVK